MAALVVLAAFTALSLVVHRLGLKLPGRSRFSRLPWWRDAAPIALEFGGLAVMVGVLAVSARRLAVSIAVFGDSIAAAVGVHQWNHPGAVCPRGVLCYLAPLTPAGWRDGQADSICVAGAIVAAVVLLYRGGLPGWLGRPWVPPSPGVVVLEAAMVALALYALTVEGHIGAVLALATAAGCAAGGLRLIRTEALA